MEKKSWGYRPFWEFFFQKKKNRFFLQQYILKHACYLVNISTVKRQEIWTTSFWDCLNMVSTKKIGTFMFKIKMTEPPEVTLPRSSVSKARMGISCQIVIFSCSWGGGRGRQTEILFLLVRRKSGSLSCLLFHLSFTFLCLCFSFKLHLEWSLFFFLCSTTQPCASFCFVWLLQTWSR